jgi:hypothetical protein
LLAAPKREDIDGTYALAIVDRLAKSLHISTGRAEADSVAVVESA